MSGSGTRALASCVLAWTLAAAAKAGPPASGPDDRQPPGLGLLKALFDPPPASAATAGRTLTRRCRSTTQGEYYLYIPDNYNPERRYPLLIALHGMRPYDTAGSQIDMWRKQADKLGLLVAAPKLASADAFGQFPLRKLGPAELADVKNVLAVIDEVISDRPVDRSAVLLSCWSMGGYLSHYLVCEHGDRFAAFAALQANFNKNVLDETKARRQANRLPVFIFYGTTDFAAVTVECKASVQWYKKLGFAVTTKELAIGHERHPELAAEFFDAVLAKRPTVEIEVTPPGRAQAPLAINLWPALSSRIGEVQSYIWDFGPRLGGACYQKSPNILIRQAGQYPVKLTVVDKAGGRHSAEAVLNVLPPGGP